MQSLLGSLNFACKVIAPGWAFCRRLINSTIGIKIPHHKIQVSVYIKKDLGLWLHFLQSYNGITLIADDSWLHNDALQLYTDSEGGNSGVLEYTSLVTGLRAYGLPSGLKMV